VHIGSIFYTNLLLYGTKKYDNCQVNAVSTFNTNLVTSALATPKLAASFAFCTEHTQLKVFLKIKSKIAKKRIHLHNSPKTNMSLITMPLIKNIYYKKINSNQFNSPIIIKS